MIRSFLTVLIITSFCTLSAQWKKIDLPFSSGHRAMDVCPNSSVLFAGSKGSVALYNPISGLLTAFEVDTNASEFRSAVALSDSVFVVANAGAPARIYSSTDGGENWLKVYENPHPSAFIDGMMALDNKNLLAYGDQIDGQFLFLESTDGGLSWEAKQLPPPASSSDAGFAASNEGILLVRDSIFIAISGENGNYILCSPNKGASWHTLKTSLKIGEGSGTFAMAYSAGNLVLAGGSYLDYEATDGNLQLLDPRTRKLTDAMSAPRGYRSGIACKNRVCLSTGTLGTDISYDGGLNWKPLNDTRYFAVRFAHNKFYLSGPNGGFATFKIKY